MAKRMAKRDEMKSGGGPGQRRLGLAALACLGCGDAALAQAINPAQLAPPSVQSAPGATRPRLTTTLPPLEAPAGADKEFVFVRDVVIEGGFPELQETTKALVAKVKGQRFSVAMIYEFAKALQQAYKTAGFSLARVTFASTNFQSGVVRLRVTDGYIERFDLSNTPERTHDLIMARVSHLIGKRHVTAGELQRAVLLVGQIPGLNVNVAEKPGTQPGGVIGVFNIQEHLIQGSFGTDNRLSKYLGTWEVQESARVNNALGFGEQFFGGIATSPDFHSFADGRAKFQFYGGGVMLPIGSDGLTATAGYAQVRTLPTPVPFSVPAGFDDIQRYAGLFERAYARVGYPLILTLDQVVKVQAAYEHISQRGQSNPLPAAIFSLPGPCGAPPCGFIPAAVNYDFFRDRYNVVRFQGDWGFFLPWGAKTMLTAEYSHGLGGRIAGDPFVGGVPMSRLGSSPDFNKVAMFARVFQSLPENFQLGLYLRAQTSFGRSLPQAEQMSLDVSDIAVSGFAAGTLNADRGMTFRSELSRPLGVMDVGIGRISPTPYAFYAWGLGTFERPYPGQFKEVRGESIGGGVRMDAAITGTPFGESINVEFAKDFSNNWMHPHGYRTNFAFQVRF